MDHSMSAEESQMKAPYSSVEKSGSTCGSSTDEQLGTVEKQKTKNYNIFERFNHHMARLGGETQGIQRIPEDERHDDSFWDTATMWVGANTVIAAYALGFLGITTFNLGIRDSMAAIICFDVLGTLPVALLSTFGPPTGMRQMVLTRYWFGSYGARCCAILNSLTCIGWSSVNTVAAVASLHQVNYKEHPMPQWAGIFLISMVSCVIALFGYRVVHFYERYAYIPNILVFFVICICLGQDGLMDWGELKSGPTEAAGILSFGGSCYGFAAGWGPYSSDYTCYKPKSTSRFKVFFYIWFWGALSCICPMLIGAFSAQRLLTSPEYKNMYDEYQTGGLLWMILVQDKLHGFGQVCMVLLSLSTIANNVPNLYTFSVSSQTVLPIFEKIPQYIWTLVITGASIGIGIAAVNNFESYLGDFMDIIAYWISFYYGIVLAEHLFFRRSYDNYNIDAYSSYVRLPFGISPIFAGCCGVMGAVLGMSQVWFTGPIGKLIGGGGDIGFELSFSFAFVGLVLTRWIERWLFPDESYVVSTDNAWWRFGTFKFPHLQRPEWTKRFDNRYWWAQKTGQAPPGEGGPAEGPFKHNVNDLTGKFLRNRGAEEGV